MNSKEMESMRRLGVPIAAALLFLLVASWAEAATGCGPGSRPLDIGMVTDGSTPMDMAMAHLFQQEIAATLAPDCCVHFPERWLLSGHSTKEGVERALRAELAPGGPRMVVALGVIASTVAASLPKRSRPVIAPYLPDFVMKRWKGRRPGPKNLVYIDSIYYLDSDIEQFRRLRRFNRVGIILDQRELFSIPNVFKLAQLFGNRHQLKVFLVPAADSAQEVLEGLPGGLDAVLVGPLWHFGPGELKRLADGLVARGLPGFALWDRGQVEAGLLAGTEVPQKHRMVARRTAIALLDILHGQRPEEVKVGFHRERELTINMATARRLNIYPSLLLQTEATLINAQKEEGAPPLDIKKAVEEAVKANLRLRSALINVQAGEEKVKEALADLLPRIDLSTGAAAIDDDRAKAAAGAAPERSWIGSAGGSILLYSDSKWASFTAQKHLQEARRMREERVRLDVTYDAAVAYLKVLRAKTIERIYKDNLALTKANLQRARIKVSTGAAGPDEVYRWEAKFANDRREVLYRESATLDAMEALNRILHRPLDQPFQPREARLRDPLFILGDDFYCRLMENPLLLQRFKRFAAKEALSHRPELKAMEAAIRAKERLRVAAKRELWLPDFSVEWNVDRYFMQDGEGERRHSPMDDTDWTVGVYARIPLFEGGKRVAKARRLAQEVSKLETDRGSLEELVTQQVLAAINRTRASYPSIRLTRQAETAAKKNLDLVTDAYIQGLKTIIDLLDAQNQYLNAELDSANAVYDFLIDLMGVQRAMGEFFIFLPNEGRRAWVNRVLAEIGVH